MGVIYIMKGRLFGKDIYEIDYTDDINDRVMSEKTGYPSINQIIFQLDFEPTDIEYCKLNLKNSLNDFVLQCAPFYKIEVDKAISILKSNAHYGVYTKLIKNNEKIVSDKSFRACFKI